MQPGNRQQMLQPRLAKGFLDLLGDRAAFSGDQRRGDTTGRTRQHGNDPARHLRAQMTQTLSPPAVCIVSFVCRAVRRA
jgi:hypothetical protein